MNSSSSELGDQNSSPGKDEVTNIPSPGSAISDVSSAPSLTDLGSQVINDEHSIVSSSSISELFTPGMIDMS